MQHPRPQNHDRRMKNIDAECIVGHKFRKLSLAGKFFAEKSQESVGDRDAGKRLPGIERRTLANANLNIACDCQ